MLKRLYISNYALIEELDVTFPGNLTIITGETGAGKSIFLEALGIALGNRADSSVLQNKSKKCIVEAEFSIKDFKLDAFFKDNELDADTEVILRREINSEGKSRAFVNDSPVTINVLKQLADSLIDIHSQHQTLLLNNSRFQFQLLDTFCGCTADTDEFRKNFHKMNGLLKQQRELLEKEKEARKEQDYLQFLSDELNQTDLDPDTFRKMEENCLSLENSESIKAAVSKAGAILGEGDENTIAALTLARQLLNSVSKYNQACSKLAERIQASQIEIKDIYQELESLNHELVFNPKELDLLNEKIDLKNRLLKKHGVNAVEELLSIRNSIEQKLLDFNAIETNSKDLEKEIDTLTKVCKKQAASISEKRKKGISSIEKHIDAQLSELSMPNAHFKIDLSPSKELSVNGQDEVAFLFSANKGSDFKELQKVASGGELSRLMLCLKALTAEKKALPTIIFDEIDTGISGDVANKMGNIFEKMAIKMQVISITHLAQIASKGKHHLFVYKNNEKEQTRSFIKHLSQDERVVEIAKMLSTGKPTESAIKNAKDLLNQN